MELGGGSPGEVKTLPVMAQLLKVVLYISSPFCLQQPRSRSRDGHFKEWGFGRVKE